MSEPSVDTRRIVNGIEFFRIGDEEDCQCARCGSSCYFVDCDNCGGEGENEDPDWQWAGTFHRCDWCRGKGGWWRCCSSRDWCLAHPNAGREAIESTARESWEPE